MTDRIVETEYDRKMLLRFIENQKLPFTATVVAGKHRTTEQNKLQRLWVKEIAEQAPGSFESAEHVRGYCKLHFGVPILRNENEKFREVYDRLIRPLDYAAKIDFMMVPMDLPVTRIMTTKQKTAYLDTIHKHFSEQGIVLTDPEDRRIAA
jgi:hypothetical protein